MAKEYVELNESQFRKTVDLIGDVDQANAIADWTTNFVFDFVGFLAGIKPGIVVVALNKLLDAVGKVSGLADTYKLFFDNSEDQMNALQRLVGSRPYRVKGYLDYTIDTVGGTEHYKKIKFSITGVKATADSPWQEIM